MQKYLALTELDNENRAIATVIYDEKVVERIEQALIEHYDATIEGLELGDLEGCFKGRVREAFFKIEGVKYEVQIEQTWLY